MDAKQTPVDAPTSQQEPDAAGASQQPARAWHCWCESGTATMCKEPIITD